MQLHASVVDLSAAFILFDALRHQGPISEGGFIKHRVSENVFKVGFINSELKILRVTLVQRDLKSPIDEFTMTMNHHRDSPWQQVE